MKKTFLALGIGVCLATYSQIPTIPTGGSGGSNPLAALAGLGGGGASAKPKPYKDVITDKAKTKKGLFTVHKVEEKYYFEIPDDLFGQEILAVTRYSKVAGGGGVYGGEEVNTQTLRFEKGPNNNVFLRVVTLISFVDSTNVISAAVKNSNVDPIRWQSQRSICPYLLNFQNKATIDCSRSTLIFLVFLILGNYFHLQMKKFHFYY